MASAPKGNQHTKGITKNSAERLKQPSGRRKFKKSKDGTAVLIEKDIEQTMSDLLEASDYSTYECKLDLVYLYSLSFYSKRENKNKFFKQIVDLGLAQLLARAWNQLFWLDYSSSAWENIRATIALMWNGSDSSSKLCRQIANMYLPEVLFQHIDHPKLCVLFSSSDEHVELNDNKHVSPSVDERTMRYRQQIILKGLLATCYNVLQREAVQNRIRKVGALKILTRVHTLEVGLLPDISISIYFLKAFIANDEEKGLINSDGRFIQKVVKMLAEAVEAGDHYARTGVSNFCAREVALVLNKLAMSDENKNNILREGGLNHYMTMLTQDGFAEDEQIVAATGLSILSFNEEGRQAIRKNVRCIETLRRLAKSRFHEVKHAAAGALWKVDEGKKPVTSNRGKHVMISYNWTHQQLVLRIKDRIESAHYPVWIDTEEMCGSINDAMASAVEEAAIVILCISERYKESPNCHAEAEYADVRERVIIPIKVQENYEPDGWLGLMIGKKLYFDFGDESKFDSTMKEFLRKLDKQWNKHFAQDEVDSSVRGKWRDSDVISWLTENGLAEHAPKWPPSPVAGPGAQKGGSPEP